MYRVDGVANQTGYGITSLTSDQPPRQPCALCCFAPLLAVQGQPAKARTKLAADAQWFNPVHTGYLGLAAAYGMRVRLASGICQIQPTD